MTTSMADVGERVVFAANDNTGTGGTGCRFEGRVQPICRIDNFKTVRPHEVRELRRRLVLFVCGFRILVHPLRDGLEFGFDGGEDLFCGFFSTHEPTLASDLGLGYGRRMPTPLRVHR